MTDSRKTPPAEDLDTLPANEAARKNLDAARQQLDRILDALNAARRAV